MAWEEGDPEVAEDGRLIGQVEIYRDGERIFRGKKQRSPMVWEPWTPIHPSRWASVSWGGKRQLKAGDVVVFTARFKGAPNLMTIDGWYDEITISGQIRDRRHRPED